MNECIKPESYISTEQEVDVESLEESPVIHKKEAYIVTREALSDLIEKPCLPACVNLYDKNIRTVASNGNIQYAMNPTQSERGLFIHIEYDSMGDNNKKIAQDLQVQGLVEISSNDTYGGIGKKVIIKGMPKLRLGMRPVFDISAFAKQSVCIAEIFQNQDIFYGRYTPDEMVEQILDAEGIEDKETAEKFLSQNDIFNENGAINPYRIIELLSTKKDSVVIDDLRTSYRTINFGKVYDEETGEFWANEELLQKHRDFIATDKTSTINDCQEK